MKKLIMNNVVFEEAQVPFNEKTENVQVSEDRSSNGDSDGSKVTPCFLRKPIVI